jgi:hypothetical protein
MQHLRAMHAASPSLLVSACDKLHNARAILADLRLLGDALFTRFTGRRDGTLWYYDELAGIFADKGAAPARSLNRAVAAMHAEALHAQELSRMPTNAIRPSASPGAERNENQRTRPLL